MCRSKTNQAKFKHNPASSVFEIYFKGWDSIVCGTGRRCRWEVWCLLSHMTVNYTTSSMTRPKPPKLIHGGVHFRSVHLHLPFPPPSSSSSLLPCDSERGRSEETADSRNRSGRLRFTNNGHFSYHLSDNFPSHSTRGWFEMWYKDRFMLTHATCRRHHFLRVSFLSIVI